MNWDKITLRNEDPCDQVQEYLDVKVDETELTDCLNALSRGGFQDVEYLKVKDDVDTAYQSQQYHVTAWRLICACGRKLDYLKC